MWVLDAGLNWAPAGDTPEGYGYFGEQPPVAFALDWRLWLLARRGPQHYYNP
jgi:hypothetical protein